MPPIASAAAAHERRHNGTARRAGTCRQWTLLATLAVAALTGLRAVGAVRATPLLEDSSSNLGRSHTGGGGSAADGKPDAAFAAPWDPPSKANLEALGKASAKCLDGKHVQLIGNSVTRHWLFILNDLINGGGANLDVSSANFTAMRMHEKVVCGSSESPAHGDGTGCSVAPRQGSVRLEFKWQHPFYSTILDASLKVRPAPDVVIANLGINDLYHSYIRPSWKPHLVKKSELLAEGLGSLPPSTYVYWRTTTRLCHSATHTEAAFFPMINRCLVVSNAHVVDALTRLAPRVHIFDAFQAAMDCSGFVDHIHSPVASIDHVLVFMSRYCGEAYGKKAVVAFPHMASQIDKATGAVLLHKCAAQRAARTFTEADEQHAALEKEEGGWKDGWEFAAGLQSPTAGPKYTVPC